MKIAVTYEDGRIFQHFGHTEQFKIYETGGRQNWSVRKSSIPTAAATARWRIF